MKKICFLLVACLMLFAVTACDSSLEIVSIEIVSMPYRLEYPVGYTGALDLKGGAIKRTSSAGSTDTWDMQDLSTVSTDADFMKVGEYTVTLTLINGPNTSFPIWVVEE